MKKQTLVLSLLGISLALATPAHAYLDPGNGSMLLQVLLAGTAGAAVLVKYYWSQFIGFLKFGKKQNEES